jgi:hypothetical protein
VDVDRHLNDMSENIRRSPVLYGKINGRSVGGLVIPSKWAWYGSVVLQVSKTSPTDTTLYWSAKLETIYTRQVKENLHGQKACCDAGTLHYALRAHVNRGRVEFCSG